MRPIHLIQSFVADRWVGATQGQVIDSPVDGHPLAAWHQEPVDTASVADHARLHGVPALQSLNFQQRAACLQALARHLQANRAALGELAALTGATALDCRVDIDVGIALLQYGASHVLNEWPDTAYLLEGVPLSLDRAGDAWASRMLVSRPGVALLRHFTTTPCMHLLRDLAVAFLAGQACVVQSSPSSALMTAGLTRLIVDAGALPKGSLQYVADAAVDMVEHLNGEDWLVFRGHREAALKQSRHTDVQERGVMTELHYDTAGSALLDESVEPGSMGFARFIDEVALSLQCKAGQHEDAIRRAWVPRRHVKEVVSALQCRLDDVDLGMGPMSSQAARKRFLQGLAAIQSKAGGPRVVPGKNTREGAHQPALVLCCDGPMQAAMHREALPIGPAVMLIPYETLDEALSLCQMRMPEGMASLGRLACADAPRRAVLASRMALNHRRIRLLSTEHGSTQDGVEGWLNWTMHAQKQSWLDAFKQRLQPCSLIGEPGDLTGCVQEYIPGSPVTTSEVHPFRRHFEDLQVGDALLTHRRTVSEADIVAFGGVSGDYFYMHFDEIAAKASPFGKRIAHGYFILSAAAGLFVWPGEGPVLANYGLDTLRFIKPVGIGDTIQAQLTCKRKTNKPAKPGQTAQGVVSWDVLVTNQHGEAVAHYDILTLVAKRGS